MAEILPKLRKTLSNQSINQSNFKDNYHEIKKIIVLVMKIMNNGQMLHQLNCFALKTTPRKSCRGSKYTLIGVFCRCAMAEKLIRQQILFFVIF